MRGRPAPSTHGEHAALPTEAAHPGAADLHRRPTADIVTLLLDEERRAAEAACAAAPSIARAADLAAAALREGGRLVYVGAGTSGRLGALDAAELPPTFGLPPDRAVAVLAGGHAAMQHSVEGAEDRPAGLRRAFARLRVDSGDLVIAVAASGVTPFTRAALDEARRRGARSVFITCAPTVAAAVAATVDIVVLLAVGPEVLAGSTRLKAGTATKLALNAISTSAMVRLGRVWRGRMVDLVATNAKLRDRARRILVELAPHIDDARAISLLRRARWHVRPALAAALLDIDVREARARLAAARGDLDALTAPRAAPSTNPRTAPSRRRR